MSVLNSMYIHQGLRTVPSVLTYALLLPKSLLCVFVFCFFIIFCKFLRYFTNVEKEMFALPGQHRTGNLAVQDGEHFESFNESCSSLNNLLKNLERHLKKYATISLTFCRVSCSMFNQSKQCNDDERKPHLCSFDCNMNDDK